jgi:hypothetical protein
VAYFAFIVWSLQQRYILADEEPAHAKPGENPHETTWYDDQLVHVSFKQRTMYFAADLIYLAYALMLEWGWSWEHGVAQKVTITLPVGDTAQSEPSSQEKMNDITTAELGEA